MKRGRITASVSAPELNLTHAGASAVYEQNGRRVEVSVLTVSPLEGETLLARAHSYKPAGENHDNHSDWQKPNFVDMEFYGGEQPFCRTVHGYLFILHTRDGPELIPFCASWLRAIDHHPPAPPTSPPPVHG